MKAEICPLMLQKDGARAADDQADQIRLHAQARKAIGTISGGNPRRSESARHLIRERLARKHGR